MLQAVQVSGHNATGMHSVLLILCLQLYNATGAAVCPVNSCSSINATGMLGWSGFLFCLQVWVTVQNIIITSGIVSAHLGPL